LFDDVLAAGPKHMYICLCNAITDGQVREAAARGARSTDDLAHELGVGLGCGRCVSCATALLCETVACIAGAASAALDSSQGNAT
jgi:bacterioferritin-associated ferredoxin